MNLSMRRPRWKTQLALTLSSFFLAGMLYPQALSPNELPLSDVVPSQGPSTATATAITSDGQAFVALWSNYVVNRDSETHSRGLGSDGGAVGLGWQLPGLPLDPTIASNGIHDLAVWSIPLGGVMGIFLDRSGDPEGSPFTIHSATASPALSNELSPSHASSI